MADLHQPCFCDGDFHSVESAENAHRLSVVFLQAGGVYSLVQFWPTQHIGRVLPRSKAKQVLVAKGDKYIEIGAE